MKQINSEIKVDNGPFSIVLGTTDKKNPEVIYAQIRTYISPKTEPKVPTIADILNKSVSKFVTSKIKSAPICEKDFISVIDIADNRMKIGKKSYLDVLLYFKPTVATMQMHRRNFKDVSLTINDTYIKDVVDYIGEELCNNEFEYSKTKK